MIDGLHTTLIILQIYMPMPIVQKAYHPCRYPKPSRPSVEHFVPNAVSPCTQIGVPVSQYTASSF